MEIFKILAFWFLTLSLCGIPIVVHHWTKKVTTTYWWWMGISVVWLAIIIGVSWWKHWQFFFNNLNSIIPAIEYEKFRTIQFALGTNICVLFTFLMPILLIADPTRRVARAFAPICSLGAMMVLLVVIPFGFSGESRFTLDYLTIGNLVSLSVDGVGSYQTYDFFYSIHLVNLLLSIGVWLTTPRYGWKGMITVGGAYGATYLQIGIIVLLTGQTGETAGIKPWDFTDGNFRMVYDMCGGNIQLAQAVFFIVVILVMFIWTFLLDFAFKRGWFQFGNKKTGVWWKYWDYEHFIPDTNERDWGKFAKLLTK